MKYLESTLVFLTLLSIPALSAAGNTELVFTAGGGYSDNIFGDSVAVNDTYAAPVIQINHYPSQTVRLSASGAYTAYHNLSGLSQIYGSGGITIVNANPDRPVSGYFSTGVSLRNYGQNYDLYDNLRGDISAALHIKLVRGLMLKTGGDVSKTKYNAAAEYSDYLKYAFFGGINITLPAENSLYIEADFTRIDFDVRTGFKESFAPGPSTLFDLISYLETGGYSIRFSRPLASHTGLKLSYASSSILRKDGEAVFGYSIDILSPWHQFRYGRAISAGIKSFALRNFIIAAEIGWSNLHYIDAVEQDHEGRLFLSGRQDETRDIVLGIRRPVSGNGGVLVIPELNVGYTNNQSNDTFYNYESFFISLALSVQM